MMADTGNRETVQKYWRAVNKLDWDALVKLMDADYVWEMPQSGERVRGIANNREMNDNYPGPPESR